MSARQQLIEEVSRQPEAVAGKLLVYLHSLPGQQGNAPAAGPEADHFAAYWSHLYGSCAGEEWEVPPEQPFEQRESW